MYRESPKFPAGTCNETASTLSGELKEIIEQFNVEVISVTCDNAKNVLKTIRILEIPIIRCIEHSVQLSLNNSIN